MPFDFGNIYAMTKDDFQKAIDYFRSRIELITNDETISVAVRRWFIKQYTKKIKKLDEAYIKLQQTINSAESSGVFVNEDTATLNSLITPNSTDRTPFKNLGVGKTKHNIAQILRIVGAVCLPLIGSIPFGIAFHRSRKRYKLRQQENIELSRFVNDSNRTFDATLATDTPFTEKEMQDLLNAPNEIERLTKLTDATSTALNPTQKKILAKKLATLKAYAQKHGYSTAKLSDPKFNTSADKVSADYASATATEPTTLIQAHEKVEKLKAAKIEAEALLEEDKDNDHLKSIVSNIDSKIASYSATAAGLVSSALSDIDGKLVAPTATDKTSLAASNASLDSVYNTPHAKLGTDLAAARTLASELEIDVTGFGNVSSKYSTLKSSNNDKLSAIKKREDYENDLATAASILGTVDIITVTDHVSATSALTKLEQVETLLNRNKTYYEGLPVTDPKRAEYEAFFARYTSDSSQIKRKQNDFDIDASAFSKYKDDINDKAFTGTETEDELIAKKAALEATLAALNDSRFDELFDGSPRMADLINARNEASSTIGKIDAKLKQIEKDKIKAEKKLPFYDSEIDKNKPLDSDPIATLLFKKKSIEDILAFIDTDSYKSDFEAESTPVILKAKSYLSALELSLEGYNKFVQKLTEAYNYLSSKLSKGKASEEKLENAQKWYNILEPLSSQAKKFGLNADYQSILKAFKGYLETKTFDSTLSVSLPHL